MIKIGKKIAWMPVVALGLVIGLILIAPHPSVSQSPNVVRYPIPDSDFPIARAVELPADAKLVYVSGQVPSVVNAAAPRTSVEAFGDTEN